MPQDPEPAKHNPATHLSDITNGIESHAKLADLQAELHKEKPNQARITALVEQLNTHPDLGSQITIWWNDPRTQSFFAELNAMGL